MGTQTDYFDRIGYKHTYDIGDRVIGKYNKVPFVGTVGNDRLINHNDGPEITIHLDLPILVDKVPKMFIIVKHKDVRRLKELKFDTDKKVLDTKK
jgi:hypothetical protein